jgi:hypothetical protein
MPFNLQVLKVTPFKAVDFKETLFISHWEKIQSIKMDFSNEREDKIQPSNRQFSYSFPDSIKFSISA